MTGPRFLHILSQTSNEFKAGRAKINSSH